MSGVGIDLDHPGTAERGDRRSPAPATGGAGSALVEAKDAATDAWRSLAGWSAEDNVFFDPDFVGPFLRAMGRPAKIATVHADGRLVAVAPVTRTQLGRIAPAHRFLAHEYGPLGVPLVDRRNIAQTVASLVDGLTGDGLSLIAPDIPLDGPVAAGLAAAAAGSGRPVVLLDRHERAVLERWTNDGAGPLASLSARRRGEYQRQMRRLAENGAVAVEAALEPTAIAKAFDEFLVLEEVGWKGRAHTSLLAREETARFAAEAVTALASRGQARIDTIRVAGKPVAMLITLAAGKTAFTWKIAYDERFARFSPGAQLMLEAGRAIMAEPGVARIDSLATADHPMIDRLWKDRMSIGTLVIGPPGGGAVFTLGVAAARAEIAARAAARHLRRRFA